MSKGLIWLMFHALQVRQGPMENFEETKHFPMSKGLIWLMFHALQVRQSPMEN
jgi:hypothetical protein